MTVTRWHRAHPAPRGRTEAQYERVEIKRL